MSEESKQGAPVGASPVCEICGREHCYRWAFPTTGYSDGKLECYRLGYERERRRAESAEIELESCRSRLSTAEKERDEALAKAELWARREGALVERGIRTDAEQLSEFRSLTADRDLWRKALCDVLELVPLHFEDIDAVRIGQSPGGDPEKGEHPKGEWVAWDSEYPEEGSVSLRLMASPSHVALAETVEDALKAPKASEIASDSSALEKALGALRAVIRSYEENLAQAREGLDRTRDVTGAIMEAAYWSGRRGAFEYAIEKLRCELGLSGGAHVEALKAQKEAEK